MAMLLAGFKCVLPDVPSCFIAAQLFVIEMCVMPHEVCYTDFTLTDCSIRKSQWNKYLYNYVRAYLELVNSLN